MKDVFEKLKENGLKMIDLLQAQEFNDTQLMDALNERNKLFEVIYNTNIDSQYLAQIKELIDQNALIMDLIEKKKHTLMENFVNFQKNYNNIMKYLNQGGQR